MGMTTEVGPDDHRDFLQSLAGEGVEEEKASQGVRDLSGKRSGTYFWMAVFFAAVLWAIYRRGVDGFLDRPVLFFGTLIGLLLVPVAIALTISARRLCEDLEDIAGGNIVDKNALRKGFNVGRTDFDWSLDGVTVGSTLVQSFYSWRAFQELRETSTAFHLMIDDGSGVIVPKRGFGDESRRQEFSTLAEERMGAGE